jgi:hypothetical protein
MDKASREVLNVFDYKNVLSQTVHHAEEDSRIIQQQRDKDILIFRQGGEDVAHEAAWTHLATLVNSQLGGFELVDETAGQGFLADDFDIYEYLANVESVLSAENNQEHVSNDENATVQRNLEDSGAATLSLNTASGRGYDSNTNLYTLGLSWTNNPQINGIPVGYEIEVLVTSNGLATANSPVSVSNVQSTTVSDLSAGVQYSFRVRRATISGGQRQLGDWSNLITASAGWVPFTPSNVQTAVSGSNIQISWTAPNNGGSAINGYVVTIKKGDGTNAYASTTCASDSTVTSCTLSQSYLQTNFALNTPEQVEAQVYAKNTYGNSPASTTGNWAQFPSTITVPDAPSAPTLVSRSTGQIVVTWTNGVSNGGSAVIAYQCRAFVNGAG